MKTFWTIGYQKCNIVTILVAVFLMTLISCQKSSELLPEEKSSDNSDDSGELSFPYPPSPPNIPLYNTLLYEYYDGYWPMRHGEYF